MGIQYCRAHPVLATLNFMKLAQPTLAGNAEMELVEAPKKIAMILAIAAI
jgi:hypothetical protein